MAKIKKKSGNPVTIRVIGPVQVRIGSGQLAVMHTFQPFNCTCPDQTYRDLPNDFHLCKHILRILGRSIKLVRAGRSSFEVESEEENGVTYTVTIANCSCGHDQISSLCPAAVAFYEELAGRRAPGEFGPAVA